MEKYKADVDFNYEPKRTNRFIAKLSEPFDINERLVKQLSRPRFVYRGDDNGVWDIIRIDFIDTILEPVSEVFLNYIKSDDFLEKSKSEEPLFDITISLLDPTNVVVEKWLIVVDMIYSIEFGGDYNYEKDNIQTISVTVKPKYCEIIK